MGCSPGHAGWPWGARGEARLTGLWPMCGVLLGSALDTWLCRTGPAIPRPTPAPPPSATLFSHAPPPLPAGLCPFPVPKLSLGHPESPGGDDLLLKPGVHSAPSPARAPQVTTLVRWVGPPHGTVEETSYPHPRRTMRPSKRSCLTSPPLCLLVTVYYVTVYCVHPALGGGGPSHSSGERMVLAQHEKLKRSAGAPGGLPGGGGLGRSSGGAEHVQMGCERRAPERGNGH